MATDGDEQAVQITASKACFPERQKIVVSKDCLAFVPSPGTALKMESTASSRHPERSEGSLRVGAEEILRCAQDDKHLRACGEARSAPSFGRNQRPTPRKRGR
jgi:hypothetical protein